MRFCDVMKCKRQALGMSQEELANIIGVSKGTISNFEIGKEVSQIVFNNIKYGFDRYVETLPKERYLEMLLVSCALSLDYKEDREKVDTLNYIILNASKLSLEMNKRMFD